MLSCKGAEDATIATSSGDAHTHTHYHDNDSATDTTCYAGCVTHVTLSLSWWCVCVCITTGCGNVCLLGGKTLSIQIIYDRDLNYPEVPKGLMNYLILY